MTAPRIPIEHRLSLKPSEAAEMLGISRSYCYELLADGTIPWVQIGKAKRVPRRALDEIVDKWQRKGA